jgi:hypothetical protein
MKIHALILCCALLLAAPLRARQQVDVIVMSNGDRLTCEINGLDAGVLYIGLPYVAGTVSVDWSKVARVESSQLFLVTAQDGSVYTGSLNSGEAQPGRPVEIQVVETPEKKVVLASKQVVQVGQTSQRFFQRLTGALDLGASYSKGNQLTQYNLSGSAQYRRERWVAGSNFTSVLSSSSGETTSTRNQLGLTAFHLLPWNNYFYGGLGSFLQSAEQGIDLQTTVGGGIGRFLKNTNRTTISLLGGAAWQGTKYKQSEILTGRQDVAAALVAVNVNLFRFDKTDLYLNAVLLPALSEPGRVFFNTNASYRIKIIGNLKWNISFYGSWDTRPPGNLPASDYGTSTGLSWTFGSRVPSSKSSQ